MNSKKKALIIIIGSILIICVFACYKPYVLWRNQNNTKQAYEKYKEGYDYWESVQPNYVLLNKNKVFWVENGKSYHSTKDCVALMKSKNIYSGSLQEAYEEGKIDPCSKCVGD